MAYSIMSGNLDDKLADWYAKMHDQLHLTMAETTEIGMAGAEKFKPALEEETRKKHYSNHHYKVANGHAADNITIWTGRNNSYKGKSHDNETDFSGAVFVGWNDRYYAMNMMRANDGTSQQVGDHFITNLRANPSVRQQILEAEQKKYKEIMDRKRSQGGD